MTNLLDDRVRRVSVLVLLLLTGLSVPSAWPADPVTDVRAFADVRYTLRAGKIIYSAAAGRP